MARELKARIDDAGAIIAALSRKGAEPAGETHFVDMYFNQPKGRVLKIAWRDNQYFLDKLQAVNGTFRIVSSRTIGDAEATAEKLSLDSGVKRVLRGHRRFFRLGDLHITINAIDNMGDFIILTGEHPSKTFIEETLAIKDPDYITVSFDELPSKNA